MTTQLSIYNFENHPVRTLLIDNEPWFIADDVCKALKLTNPTMSLKSLDEDERSKFNLGRQGKVNIINESGLFTLILRCRDAVIKGTVPYRFRKWTTSEVLPSIRKTGRYEIQPQIPKIEPHTIEVNKANLECLVHHARIARDILESNKIYDILDSLGNNTVSQAYQHLKHGLLGASNLHVGVY